jgi:hypothetical protein
MREKGERKSPSPPLAKGGEGQGEGGSTPTPEVEQHLQQVGGVHHPIAVHIHTTEIAAHAAEGKQHCLQVGVVDAVILVNIAVVRGATGLGIQQEGFNRPVAAF